MHAQINEQSKSEEESE